MQVVTLITKRSVVVSKGIDREREKGMELHIFGPANKMVCVSLVETCYKIDMTNPELMLKYQAY